MKVNNVEIFDSLSVVDIFKWIVIFVLLVVVVVGNYLYGEMFVVFCVVGVVVLIIVVFGVVVIIIKGKVVIVFVCEFCMEVCKVVWFIC